MIPYTAHRITYADEAAVLRALRSDHLTQGPEVERFEEELAALAGAKYTVAVNSGTAALHLALLAAGARPGVEVIVPAISFVATANAALMTGASVRFADCEPETGFFSPHTEVRLGVERIVVPVTLGGMNGEFVQHSYAGLSWVIDACHGPLRSFGSIPEAACFSFHPAKHVAAGEGGAVVTNDQGLADQMRLLRSHGRRGTEMVAMGWNYRMPDLNAALARAQLVRYREGVARRRELAAVYDRAFAGHPVIQPVPHGPDSARHLYQVLLPDGYAKAWNPAAGIPKYRDWVAHVLRERGIGTAVHYPVIPLQPYYRERYGYQPGQFPGAEAYAARTLSLPLYPTLSEADQRRVIEAMLEVCR